MPRVQDALRYSPRYAWCGPVQSGLTLSAIVEEQSRGAKACAVRSIGASAGAAPFQSKAETIMHSVFETAPAPSAIPITFATKATWEAICAELAAPARQFAQANGFAAKPGACLT